MQYCKVPTLSRNTRKAFVYVITLDNDNKYYLTRNSLKIIFIILLSGKTQITYKSLRNSLYIGNSAFFFEIQAP